MSSRCGQADPQALADLIARLEAATEPSRILDLSIRKVVGVCIPLRALCGHDDGNWCRIVGDQIIEIGHARVSGMNSTDFYLPRYTASIDAALSLVPSAVEWSVNADLENGCYYAVVANDVWDEAFEDVSGRSVTPALALCIAALKARQQGESP